MADVTITMDGRTLTVPAGSTILEAARQNDIHIPTLCFLEKLDPRASCRMCVVEVEGARTFQHACAAKVREGMVIHTDTEAVRASRKLTLQLLLSDHNVDCHHCMRIGSSRCDDLDPTFCETCFFCDCVRDGFCELQALAREYGVDQLPFPQHHGRYTADDSAVIVRDPNKCIKCKRCVDVCGGVQTVHNLAASGRGNGVLVAPAFGKPMAESSCIGCSRCVEVCPVGAIYVKEHKDEVVYHAHQWGTNAVAQLDPALIPELEKIWKKGKAPVTEQQVAGALKKIGFSHVTGSADAWKVLEKEGEEKLDARLKEGPAIVASGMAARKVLERSFGELSDRFVLLPSAQTVFGDMAEDHFGREDKKLITVSVGPLGPDAGEAAETGCVDYVINTRELYRIMVRTGAEPNPKRVSEPETWCAVSPSGKYGPVLGSGVWNMEKEAEVMDLTVDGRNLHCAVCHNPSQLRRLLDGTDDFDVIRVIA